jgi:hypothetical protein
VDNALHHRRQAELCLQIAELISDPAAAKLLREDAIRHFAEATELGKMGRAPTTGIRQAQSLRLLIGADVPAKRKKV